MFILLKLKLAESVDAVKTTNILADRCIGRNGCSRIIGYGVC
jgi:hypothetical protein